MTGVAFYLIIFIIGLLLVHLFKAVRLYLVLMETGMSFSRFLYLYLETTCINLIIPFKLGEIYRACRLSVETKKAQIGILSVATDRFFDIICLLILIFAFKVIGYGQLSGAILLLLAVVVIFAVAYIMFPSTYKYLNRYIIVNRCSQGYLNILSALEVLRQWHDYLSSLLRGRSALIMVASLLGWIFEGFTLKALSEIIGESYGFDEYSEYISSIFAGGGNRLLTYYSTVSAVILAVLVIILAVMGLVKGKNLKKNRG